MKSAGEKVTDALILTGMTTYTVVALFHAAAMWTLRKNFFIALRRVLGSKGSKYRVVGPTFHYMCCGRPLEHAKHTALSAHTPGAAHF